MAKRSQPTTSAVAQTAPNDTFDFVLCRDFVWQSFESIRLQGTVAEINSLMERVNQNHTVRAASNEDHLSALHALTISLETTAQAVPVTFQDLRNYLNSPAYRNLAGETVRKALISSQQRKDLFHRLTAGTDLPLTAISILLNLFGKFSGKVYEVGVVTFKGMIEDVPTFRVQLHAANPGAVPDTTVWIAKDCHYTEDEVSGIQWSGIAPAPTAPAAQSLASLSLAGRRDSLPTFDLDFSSSDNELNLDDFDLNAFLDSVGDQAHEAHDPSAEPAAIDESASSYRRDGKRRRGVPGAPMKDTELPIELLSDVTLEELLIYYPEHVFHWPGLALLALHTNIRSKVKDEKGFKAMADLVNDSRDLHNEEIKHAEPITRVMVRQWLTGAARVLLGSEYTPKQEDHLKALYNAIATDTTVNDVAEFLNKHLWDPPLEGEMEGLFPPVPLVNVGMSVQNHPEHGQFKERIFTTLSGTELAPPPIIGPHQFHPMVLKLNDFTNSEATLAQAPLTGQTKGATRTLPRDRYPRHISQDDMVEKYWADLYGEPLLWTLLEHTMADISKRVPEEGYRTYSKARSQFEATLRQRKRTAVKERAHRRGRPFKEVLKAFERETTDWGKRKGRKDRLPNGMRARDVQTRKRRCGWASDTEDGQFQHILPKRRKTRTAAKKAETQKQDAQGFRPRLPSLPALSPPLPGEGWEYPPESEFRMKSKPGRYIAGQKLPPVQAQPPALVANMLPEVVAESSLSMVATNKPPLVNAANDMRMRFSFSYEAENEAAGEDGDDGVDTEGEVDKQGFALLAQYVRGR